MNAAVATGLVVDGRAAGRAAPAVAVGVAAAAAAPLPTTGVPTTAEGAKVETRRAQSTSSSFTGGGGRGGGGGRDGARGMAHLQGGRRRRKGQKTLTSFWGLSVSGRPT